MRFKYSELWIALVLIVLITFGYIQTAARTAIPAASGFFGHSLGVIGFILMLMTEILYSLRKRYQFARWGKLQNWLSFHIITGLVGPYMVLLHSSWKFNGLAGILMLLTIIIVISGFIGRYFYTSIPRSIDGTYLEAEQISIMVKDTEDSISDWKLSQPETFKRAEQIISDLGNNKVSHYKKLKLQKELRAFSEHQDASVIDELISLLEQLDLMSRQLDQLDRTRRLLAIWHTFHVPIGIALFFIAFIHIAATLYYSTFLH
jgi:hypothetical protein